MTHDQLKSRYKLYNNEQLKLIHDTHHKAAADNAREAALVAREIKRRQKHD